MVYQPALLDLDRHILSKILAALDPVSLARVITACRALRTAGSDEALWQEHCKKRWIHPHKHLLHGTALRLGGLQGVPVASLHVTMLCSAQLLSSFLR